MILLNEGNGNLVYEIGQAVLKMVSKAGSVDIKDLLEVLTAVALNMSVAILFHSYSKRRLSLNCFP